MYAWIVQEICGHALANIDCSTWTHTLTFCCFSPCQRYGVSDHGTQIGAWAQRRGSASTFHLPSTTRPGSASKQRKVNHGADPPHSPPDDLQRKPGVTAVLFLNILSSHWFTIIPEPCWPSTHSRCHLHNLQFYHHGCTAALNPIKAIKSKQGINIWIC